MQVTDPLMGFQTHEKLGIHQLQVKQTKHCSTLAAFPDYSIKCPTVFNLETKLLKMPKF